MTRAHAEAAKNIKTATDKDYNKQSFPTFPVSGLTIILIIKDSDKYNQP